MSSPAPTVQPPHLSYSQDLGQGRFASRMRVSGMHCAACAGTVERLLRKAGVESAQVNAATSRARVVWDSANGAPEVWMAALEQSGYSITPLEGVDYLEQARLAQRKALWRWLVAGFCMMQVMMYMWPLYGFFGANDIDFDSERLLRWAMLLLSIPVLLFSSGPYFSSAWRDIQQRRVSMDLPVAIGIALAFGVSATATLYPRGAWGALLYFDSLTMFVFILLSGRWLEAHLKSQTAGALDTLGAQMPQRAMRLLANGELESVSVRQLRAGDRVRVRVGEQIPADGVVLTGSSWVDEALLTGESKPVHKSSGSAVVAGSINQSQTLEITVEQVGSDTRFAQIVALMERAADAKPKLVQLADRLAQPFLIAVLGIAALAWGFWYAQGDAQRGLVIAINVLIVTCPCALAMAAPGALLSATAALARQGVLVRDIGILEKLTHISHIMFDKTGTLTHDAIAVKALDVCGDTTAAQAWGWAKALAQHSLHPASKAIVNRSSSEHLAFVASDVQETPGQGLEGLIDGVRYRLGRASWCGLAAGPQAGMQVCLARDGIALAYFSLDEAMRADAPAALQALQQQGLQLSISSGDQEAAVARIAESLGLQLPYQAGRTPQDKLQELRRLQAAGAKVLMVGDGINDAPVLAGADVSMAMAGSAPLAQVQADIVFLQDHLMNVPLSLAHARKTMRIVKENLLWALLYNCIAIPLALSGVLTPWIAGLGMALSSIIVLLNATRLQKIKT